MAELAASSPKRSLCEIQRGEDGAAVGKRDMAMSSLRAPQESRRRLPLCGIIVFFEYQLFYKQMRRCGGIGRRKGLKIPRWQHRTGSSPVTGTIESVRKMRTDSVSSLRRFSLKVSAFFYFFRRRFSRRMLFRQKLRRNRRC